DPDAAFRRFDSFLSGLPAGVQLFSLLHANPGLLDLLAGIMGTAPRLADRLSQRPSLLDALLTPDMPTPEDYGRIAEEIAAAQPFEEALDAARQLADEQRLLLGVRVLEGAMAPDALGRAYAALAETM